MTHSKFNAVLLLLAVAALPAARPTLARDETEAPAAPAAGERLFLVLLAAGTSRVPLPREEVARMQAAHLGNLTRLAKEGKSPLAGPLGADSKRTRGIVIVRASSVEAVVGEFAADPFVANDYLAVRALPWTKTKGRFAPVPEKGKQGTTRINDV